MHYNTLPKPLHICRCTSFNIPNIPGTVLHLQTPSWTKSHIHQISSIIYTCHAEYLQNLPKHLDINSFDFSAFLTHWYTSLNISVVQGHAPMLSLVFILTHQFGIFHPLLLKFSFALGSIVKHNYSPSPFSESTPGSPSTIPFSFTFYLFLLSHFPPFILISFFIFNVLDLYISFISFRLPLPNILKYLYIHVFVASLFFEITSSTSPL